MLGAVLGDLQGVIRGVDDILTDPVDLIPEHEGIFPGRNPFEGVLGTIAGDDTVLIVVSDGKTAEKLTKLLLDAASKKADVSSESAESADSANFAESDKSAESRKSVADGKNRENREYFVKTEKT